MIGPWLRFFRVVNLPTVPGDVLVGAAGFLVGRGVELHGIATTLCAASMASVFVYLFGLADNDLVGAKTDAGRPLPDGELSPRAARIARAMCLAVAFALGAVARLPWTWWIVLLVLIAEIVAYNRTKNAIRMGLCRGFNVLAGGAALVDGARGGFECTAGAALLWTFYIAAVTWYSEGEENDPAKKRRVGFLVGALVYLQLIALMVFTLVNPALVPLLLVGALLLVVLRILKIILPKVSAS